MLAESMSGICHAQHVSGSGISVEETVSVSSPLYTSIPPLDGIGRRKMRGGLKISEVFVWRLVGIR
jgi:hypothetical protein